MRIRAIFEKIKDWQFEENCWPFLYAKVCNLYANIFDEFLTIKKAHKMGVLVELLMGIGPMTPPYQHTNLCFKLVPKPQNHP